MVSIPRLLLAGTFPFDLPQGPTIGLLLATDDVGKECASPRFVSWNVASFAADAEVVRDHPASFRISLGNDGQGVVDPRRDGEPYGEARLRTDALGSWDLVAPVSIEKLTQLARDGVAGIVLREASKLGPAFLSALAAAVRSAGLALLVDAMGLDEAQIQAISEHTAALVLPSKLSSADLLKHGKSLRHVAPLYLEARAGDLGLEQIALVDGVVGHHLSKDAIDTIDAALDQLAGANGDIRLLSAQSAPIAAVLRSRPGDLRHAERAWLVLANRTDHAIAVAPEEYLVSAAATFSLTRAAGGEADLIIGVGTISIHELHRREPIIDASVPGMSATDAADSPRLVLEGISPRVAGGMFPVKQVVGDDVIVEALLYGDGHEQLAAELQWRALDEDEWQVARMGQLPNDAWRAALRLDRLGRHEFAVEGWLDRYGGYRRDFGKKRDAEVAEAVDYAEGRLLAEQAIARADRETSAAITDWLSRYDAAAHDDERASLLLGNDIAGLMDLADDRPHRIRSMPQWIDAERIEARFSSWYELFPRSITDDKARHGTFDDVIGRLPAIRAMGFDTLYFPPIHPIGRKNRKGPNNTLTPGPDDVGSPYAIGSAEGGHDAIHPALGSFDDFRRLIAAAADHGLEIALDFAIQCSPDHPWLTEHPGWFAWRPDGSMKYAENPPKKYQDIVNVDFYGPDAVPDLWTRLRDIVLLWIGHGVKVFRVDNPHTKPLPFWEWMIGDVRARHPDAIFLAEAFTRPNMMYRLAKIGFSQSYTYFTWRDSKQELVDYVTELTTTAPRDFYRPHFFVNTPDINPPYLQTSGRPGFRIRAALAATLSGLFGVYSGFELCEAAPVPGKEEYLDSEKYEIRPRDWQAPGNIIDDITLLNRLRRTHPALQTHLNTRFYVARNESVIYYGKPALDGSDMILVMVNLDPHHAQETSFEVPLWEFGRPDDGAVSVEDLAHGYRFEWRGKDQWIRIDPQEPYRIWRIWSAS